MYLTHTFAHRETLSRAHGWLTRLGFHPREVHAPKSSIPRLMVPVEQLGAPAWQTEIEQAKRDGDRRSQAIAQPGNLDKGD